LVCKTRGKKGTLKTREEKEGAREKKEEKETDRGKG
jgi:hypothetical protein